MSRRIDRVARAVVLALAGACAGLVAASASAAPTGTPAIGGPGHIVPGHYIRLTAYGFRSGSVLSVSISESDGGNSGITIKRTWKVRSAQPLSLSFRWPTYYLVCAGAHGPCGGQPWEHNASAIVTVSSTTPWQVASTPVYIP